MFGFFSFGGSSSRREVSGIRLDDAGKELCTKRRSAWCKSNSGSCHKRQKPQAPTPQAPIRNRQLRKVANAKGLNLNTNLTQLNLT